MPAPLLDPGQTYGIRHLNYRGLVFDLSYTGISIGWGGWNKDYAFGGMGSHAGPTYARNNRIVGNRIHFSCKDVDGA